MQNSTERFSHFTHKPPEVKSSSASEKDATLDFIKTWAAVSVVASVCLHVILQSLENGRKTIFGSKTFVTRSISFQ